MTTGRIARKPPNTARRIGRTVYFSAARGAATAAGSAAVTAIIQWWVHHG